MQGPFLRKYGVQTTINFHLFEIDGVDFRVDAADGGTDCSIMKDEGAEATCTNDFTDEGAGYSLVLTATEMQAARIVVYVVDTATKVWLDTAIVIETYGHASAMHSIDLDDSVRAGLTALPNAAADAAGGLPISDAGELDLDTKLANTNEITAARMGALTDWINGGRLDLILDIIAADVVNIDGDAMRGTDSAALASVCTEARLAELAAANLPADVDTLLSRITAAVALASVCTEARLAELDAGNLPTDIAAIPTAAEIQAEMEEDGASILDTLRDDLADGGRLDLLLDAIKAVTDNLPDSGALNDLATILEDTATTLPATLATIAGYLDAEIAAILEDTAELQTDLKNGGRLDLLIDELTAQGDTNEGKIDTIDGIVDTLLTRITAAVALASVCTEARLAELDAANLPADVAACATPAEVNAQVLDVMNVDTFAEPGQGAPPATASIFAKINYLYKSWRNKKDNDGSTRNIYDDAGVVVDQKSTVSEAAGTVTVGEVESGP